MIVVVIDVIDDQPRGRSLHEMTSSNHTIRSCRRLLRATVTEIKMNKWSQLPKMRTLTTDQKRDVLTSNNRLLLLLPILLIRKNSQLEALILEVYNTPLPSWAL